MAAVAREQAALATESPARAAATTLRKGKDEPLVLDGPFAETKEQLLGFHLVDYDTDEEAIAAARKLREVNPTAVYEIRPVKLYVPADDFGAG